MPPAALRLRSDESLVSLFRAGREDAFEVIHERHRRRLHASAARALRSSGGDAEGVVQEAFVRAHRALRDADHPVELKPWLHRVVRNLCIDELRRARVGAAPLEDGDRAGADEDVYATLSRRHDLRRLIEDLSDLPEQQRSALLLRELDGLSHDEVAATLDVSPAASRQLVARARNGLVAAAQARDADCSAIREVLLAAHDERRRPSEHAVRHVKGCTACRAFREGLKANRTRLRALIPPLGGGPLGGLLHLLGGGGAAAGGTSVAAKVAAAGCCAVLAAGGATLWVEGRRDVVRGTSPGAEAGGRTLIGTPIRAGTTLPATVALSTLTVSLDTRARRAAHVRCPAGQGAAGLTQPRNQDGTVAVGRLRIYGLSDADVDALEAGRGRRAATLYYAARRADGAVIKVGVLCKRRR